MKVMARVYNDDWWCVMAMVMLKLLRVLGR